MPKRYLTPELVPLPFDLKFCSTEKTYLQEMRRLKVRDPIGFCEGAYATTTYIYDTPTGVDVCIVCIDRPDLLEGTPRDRAEAYSLLVHEAVHVFQHVCEKIGEVKPSPEFEAYSIQNIAWALFKELV